MTNRFRRLPGLLGRTRAPALVVVVLLAAVAGCGQRGGSASFGATSTTGPAPTAGTPAPSTVPTTQTTQATPTPPTFPKDAAAYTKAALVAWAARDVSTLDQFEEPGGQLHTMLACTGCYNTAFTLANCSGAAGSTYCLYINAVGDELRLRVNNQLLGYPRAMGTGSSFDPITFPSDDTAYAKEALAAWQAGDDPRLALLCAQPYSVVTMTALGANRSASWTASGSEGAAGTVYVRFSDPAGHTLAFGFVNGPPAPTTGPGSQDRITTIVYLP